MRNSKRKKIGENSNSPKYFSYLQIKLICAFAYKDNYFGTLWYLYTKRLMRERNGFKSILWRCFYFKNPFKVGDFKKIIGKNKEKKI